MGWYKDVSEILKKEPEVWLAYLYGQQLDNVPHLIRTRARVRGVVPRFLRYIIFMLRYLSIKQPACLSSRTEFLIFAGTENQANSLENTVQFLKENGKRLVGIGHVNILHDKEREVNYVPFKFNFFDVIKSIIVSSSKVASLYRSLRLNNPAATRFYFDEFCRVYSYLIYFLRVLDKTRPDFVITSNDHNVPNRSLLAVAHYLGIKTVYLQHASVSSLFPALRVDYAFLDGRYALDIYRECEKNQPANNRNVPMPKVFLTGQKKSLERRKGHEAEGIGIALNPLDDTEAAIQFVKELLGASQQIFVRWHPGQPAYEIQQYQKVFGGCPQVTLSNPRSETVSAYLKNICWLVAGNSSIHLEAALAGVTPIYFEISPPDHPDYYGYVRHGLARKANTAADIVELIGARIKSEGPDIAALRYYSATYLTEWEGREGELVANCLMRLSEGEKPPIPSLELLIE